MEMLETLLVVALFPWKLPETLLMMTASPLALLLCLAPRPRASLAEVPHDRHDPGRYVLTSQMALLTPWATGFEGRWAPQAQLCRRAAGC